MNAPQVKVSIRLRQTASSRLDQNARVAGLSRGAYLTRLLDGAPPVVASSDRAAMFNALNASSAELALLSRDMNHLTRLLLQGSSVSARSWFGSWSDVIRSRMKRVEYRMGQRPRSVGCALRARDFVMAALRVQ